LNTELEQAYLNSVSQRVLGTNSQVQMSGTVRDGAFDQEMKAYDPTVRERLAEFFQMGFEGIGIDRAKARENAQSLMGGQSSNLPLGIGVADIVPFLGTALQTQEAARSAEHAATFAQSGDYKNAAIETATAALGFVPGVAGTVKYGKPVLKAMQDSNGGNLPVGLSIKPVDAIPTGEPGQFSGKLQLFQSVVTKASQKASQGSVKLSDKVSKEQLIQLQPQYRVKVVGAYKPEGGMQNITNTVNPGNYQEMSSRLDELGAAFPDPLQSNESFASMMATVYNSNEVPIPPRWLIRNANNMDEWSSWFGRMTPNQIAEAGRGFSIVDKFKTIYGDGTATADTTGRLMMWAMLSRRASAYPHESGFLDLAEQMTPLIQKAVRGEYTDVDVEAGLAIIQKYIPKGSPGKSVTSNANDFVRTFLVKMSDKMPDGRTKLQALHNMIADPNMTGPQIRREFYGLADSVGIKNKVLSFALLVSGRTDVMVLDRIQINRLFGDGNKIYDDVAQIFDGGPGLAMYEGMERSIEKRIKDLYARVGRPNDASLGRYHWESWVLSSGQEVAHPTLETMVKAAKGEASPYVNVPVMEGRTHKTVYGVKYQRLPNGTNQFVYSASDGTEYAMNKDQLEAMFKSVMNGKQKLVPKDFPGVNYFEQDVLPDGSPNPYFGKPWYTWPGVDKDGIDKRAAEYGARINTSSRSGSVETDVGNAAADGSSRKPRTTSRITRGQAPQKGAK